MKLFGLFIACIVSTLLADEIFENNRWIAYILVAITYILFFFCGFANILTTYMPR